MNPKDPLKPIKIESKEARKILPSPLLSDANALPESPKRRKMSTQEILTPRPISKNQEPIQPSAIPEPPKKELTESTEQRADATVYSPAKRLELASLLWGEGENEYATGVGFDFEVEDEEAANPKKEKDPSGTKAPSQKNLREELQRRREQKEAALSAKATPKPEEPKQTASPNTAQKASASATGTQRSNKQFERAFNRRECSFPGMLTVLIPEKTFQPQKYAVRVIDISPSGVRLETRQLDQEAAECLSNERWYARLEMLVPHRDKLRLRGRIAWVRYEPTQSQIGLKFEVDSPYIEELFTDTVNKALQMEELVLRSPIIDPFPSMTPSDVFEFSGRVSADCEKVRVTTIRGAAFEAVPSNGHFKIKIPLVQNQTNFLSFISVNQRKESIPTPAAILHKVGVAETVSYAHSNLVESFDVSPTGRHLSMTVTGSPARFFQVLKAIEASLADATELTLNLDFHGDAKQAAKKLKHLLPEEHKE